MRTYTFLLMLFWCSTGFSQKDFSFQISAGPNFYFNNLVIFTDNVEPINYSFYTKIMWNTRYRLSFGLEAGYVNLYRLNDFEKSVGYSDINMVAMPVHAAIEMKLYKNLYSTFTFGPSFFRNYLKSPKGEQTTHTFSIADFSIGVGYRKTFSTNMFFGIEIRHYYSSKSEDRNLTIPISLGWNF